jgi:hypothetical protein
MRESERERHTHDEEESDDGGDRINGKRKCGEDRDNTLSRGGREGKVR